MAAIHLQPTSDVGTTYKRALQRFHLSRDIVVPSDFSELRLIDPPDNWIVLETQLKDDAMRKPRDYDAELQALDDKAKALRARKLEQLGQLVIATGADALSVEQLAGVLLIAADNKDATATETQRVRGAAFFRDTGRARGCAGSRERSAAPGDRDAPSAAPEPSAP